MKCVIPGTHMKVFGRAVHSLSKIGEELYIEALEHGLALRTVNSSRSAYACFLFTPTFFQHYDDGCGDASSQDRDDTLRCKIAMKSILTVFRSLATIEKTVERCKIRLNMKDSRLVFQLYCRHGIVKTHNLAFIECETLQAVFAKDMCPNSLTAASKLLCDAVMNFQNTQEEITLIVSPQKIVLKNYVEDEPDPNKVMHTNLSLEPEEFDNCQVGVDTEVTFCLKELRAILAFSEVTTLPLTLTFETAGRPIVFTIDSDSTFEGNFVLATLADQQTQSQAATHARTATQKRSSEQTKRSEQLASAYEMLNDDTDFDEMIQNDTTLLDQPSVEALRMAPSVCEERTMCTSVKPGSSALGDNMTVVSRDNSPIVQSSNKSEESPVIPVPLMNLRVTLGDDTLGEDPDEEEEEAIPGTPPAKRFRSLFFGSSQVSQTQTSQPSCAASKVLAEDTDDED
ncbi:cell cycle checkpoint control protein RAD9A-like isoform X5 [Dreissena polymorpha]|uniref:cell cycle checkpoint control protein RAD9A-like isoform X5 n=1 Tax=Dreissena polymorpha TaxID=45954 RepID=UPI00226491DD|nr:cell cycle checkpoint control protein RAD9A-like isoform X5 [Dreissena polymorpha]